MGLILPAVYYYTLKGRSDLTLAPGEIANETLKLSRAVAIILLIGYLIYVLFQTKSHDGLFTEIYAHDDHRDEDRHKDLAKDKLTLIESIIAIIIALACVSLIAVFLVKQIPYMVEERHISDAFVGLILIPLVEKIAGMSSMSPSPQHENDQYHNRNEKYTNCDASRTSHLGRRSLGQPNELRPRPRPRRIHPNRTPQHAPRNHRRLGHRRLHGLEIRNLRCCVSYPRYSRRRQLFKRWQEQLS